MAAYSSRPSKQLVLLVFDKYGLLAQPEGEEETEGERKREGKREREEEEGQRIERIEINA